MIEAITVFFMLSSISPLSFSFLSTSSCISSVVISCLHCLVSFSVIPRLLRYSPRLRARSHNFSAELWTALFVLPTHFLLCPPLPLFSNIWRASVKYSCTSNCCLRFLISTNHNIYLSVLLPVKFTFI